MISSQCGFLGRGVIMGFPSGRRGGAHLPEYGEGLAIATVSVCHRLQQKHDLAEAIRFLNISIMIRS